MDGARLVDGAPSAATNVSRGPRRIMGDFTEDEVSTLHDQFCDALVSVFDTHKSAYGWGHKKLVVV